MSKQRVNVIGAGILGLWQALTLAKRGFSVHLYEKSDTAFSTSSSQFAGAMLAPFCEAEPSKPTILEFGLQSLELWRASQVDISFHGTLVVAPPRDRSELDIFAKRTSGHRLIEQVELSELESDLAIQFSSALYFEGEAHLSPRVVMLQLLDFIKTTGAKVTFGAKKVSEPSDYTIDCRGMGASDDIEGLRPVRGEMAVVKANEIRFNRPVRLLHPRMPCYIVPWGDDHYMIGATVIESEDEGPVTLRSALELLGAAFTVHPSFGEARIIELSAGLRPAFATNVPKIQVYENHISVNGAYRHGFLLAPLLAKLVADYLESGDTQSELFQ